MVMNVIRATRSARVSLRAPAVSSEELQAKLARLMAARNYSDARPEGSTGSSKGFSQREQAEEGQYIRKREQEQLKASQEKLKAAQAEVDAAQKKVDEGKK